MKSNLKPYKTSHTAGYQKGLGDYYGSGIVAKVGKVRSDSMGSQTLTPKQLKKPPKTLA